MQWNAGGWFGAQLGGTAWMLVAGLLSIAQDVRAALIVLGLFVVVNAIGTGLWRARQRLSPYPAIQVLLLAVGAAGLGAIYVLDAAGIFQRIQSGPSVSARSTYLILGGIVAILMISFHLRFGRKPPGGSP